MIFKMFWFFHQNYDKMLIIITTVKMGGKVEKTMESALEGPQTPTNTLPSGKGHDGDTGTMVIVLVDDVWPWCDADKFWGLLHKSVINTKVVSADGTQSSNHNFVEAKLLSHKLTPLQYTRSLRPFGKMYRKSEEVQIIWDNSNFLIYLIYI